MISRSCTHAKTFSREIIFNQWKCHERPRVFDESFVTSVFLLITLRLRDVLIEPSLLWNFPSNVITSEHTKLPFSTSQILMETWGAVVAQWIRPRILNREVPGSKLLAAALVPLGKALYPHCLVPQKGHKAISTLVSCL